MFKILIYSIVKKIIVIPKLPFYANFCLHAGRCKKGPRPLVIIFKILKDKKAHIQKTFAKSGNFYVKCFGDIS